MTAIPPLTDATVRAICDILGDTGEGLTASEIDKLLAECRIPEPRPAQDSQLSPFFSVRKPNKRDRLYAALSRQQQRDRCANSVLSFIKTVMQPVRYTREPRVFDERRGRLNEVLAFAGLAVGPDGQLFRSTPARTLQEAQARAARLRRRLQERVVHPDVLRFCRAELLHDNYFHAVFETMKSIADKIREKSGLDLDGAKLVDKAFGRMTKGYSILAFNSLITETERSEHFGFMNMLRGLFGAFRNVTAHEPKIKWPIEEQDALDILTFASLLHRRLDKVVETRVGR